MATHLPSVEHEQAIVDRAYVLLEAMRERTMAALGAAATDARLTDAIESKLVEAELAIRLKALAPSNAPLVFGRIDESCPPAAPAGTHGDRHYIGRRHVEDAYGDAFVVDWRAPVATAFYRATWADPFGLDHRSRFAVDGGVVAGLFDEDFTDPSGEASGSGGVPDPLLAELDRARSGAMRDIVATIQAEQDAVIRAPLESLIVVQGGPGTGKTAVGLHRAAYLLYTHRTDFERNRLLVVGPNRLFLTYISQVLPSLGETSVVQGTVETLCARYVVRGHDSLETRRMKGDSRMAEVIRRAVTGKVRTDVGDLSVMTAFGSAFVPGEEVAATVEEVVSRQMSLTEAKSVFRDRVLAAAWRRRFELTGEPTKQFAFTDSLRLSKGFKAYIDAVFPSQSPIMVVRALLGNPRALRDASAGLLTEPERALLRRRLAKKPADEAWTRADLALLDEANHLITGETVAFGHVVVDEAQDLSAMELRLVARRSPTRSMTVLGDLAQATTPGGQSSWGLALHELGHARSDAFGRESGAARKVGEVSVLDLGYRVPEALIDYANRLLPIAAPGVPECRSVREGGRPPLIVEVRADVLVAELQRQVHDLATRCGVVGVIVAQTLLDDIAEVGAASGWADARATSSIEHGVTVLGADVAKGLEFDAVVVVEPQRIVSDSGDPGLRVLYVALTRATQEVVVLTTTGMPHPLNESASPADTGAVGA